MEQYKKEVNLVWLKRDLRTTDHEPLSLACESNLPFLCFYVFEPSIIEYPDTSLRHLQFIYKSLQKMNLQLKDRGVQIPIFYSEIINLLTYFIKFFNIHTIFSYRESGVAITYKRDRLVKKFTNENRIKWSESMRDGIRRGIPNRDGWDEQWFSYASGSEHRVHWKREQLVTLENPFPIPEDLEKKLSDYPKTFQPAGELVGIKYLNSFLESRGFTYNRHISHPLESRRSCSRLSPYLSWGNLSVRQVYRAVKNAYHPIGTSKNYESFLQRLKWRSHFMQKFEEDCEYETKFLNSGYDVINYPYREDYLEAWKNGKTGYPLVDACMRCLIETGWINFRMRAMVVSFVTHNLFQDWRHISHYLARLFLDYEPGIHYPQIQMQAGTTGINLVRIYNPVKQSKEKDKNGDFIKTWIPELKNISPEVLHSPFDISEMERVLLGIPPESIYPKPIIDIKTSARHARDVLFSLKKTQSVRQENKKILERHVRKQNKNKI